MAIFSKEFGAKVNWMELINTGELYEEDEKVPKWFNFKPLEDKTDRFVESTIKVKIHIHGEVVSEYKIPGLVSIVTGREFINGKVLYAYDSMHKPQFIDLPKAASVESLYPIFLG